MWSMETFRHLLVKKIEFSLSPGDRKSFLGGIHDDEYLCNS